MNKKISIIFGTRPEAIKLCPVVLALKANPAFECKVCVTGQHREMLQQVLDVFGVVPDKDLALMRPNQTLGGLTSRAIAAIDEYLAEEMPDAVMVQGDTTTVLAGALASFYHHIPVAHVEAGLRTWNLESPWPEEANRVLTTRIARWHFCPTESNRANLLKEGVPEKGIYVTGNTVIDALLMAKEMVRKKPPVLEGLPSSLMATEERMVLITGHRRENFGEGFENICTAIRNLAERFPETHFVYPVHLNPNVREPVGRILGHHRGKNVHLIEPQSYLPFVALMNRAYLILTDSGGVQEEAPSLGKPVLVMRDTTERPEAVTAGTVKIIGTAQDSIEEETALLLNDQDEYKKMAAAVNPYGDGMAVERIVKIMEESL
ncbi:MAG: UDP-N-acetylglucosamine 2-epimerase (non-hydrolyzing) [Kiritimatiellae bacterium]|nr:UDP-N-acetylglucosamine 2-epimerase (non-hydrolyzing) [Kiritimatiellia bacterium]